VVKRNGKKGEIAGADKKDMLKKLCFDSFQDVFQKWAFGVQTSTFISIVNAIRRAAPRFKEPGGVWPNYSYSKLLKEN
jgi:hypothetical protein